LQDECIVVVLDHVRGAMTPDEMFAVYREHRAAEDRHDFSAVMATLAPDCFLEQVSLGLRSEGQEDAAMAYEEWFGAFPISAPSRAGIAFGDDALVGYGQLHGTMKRPWLGLAPTGREFTGPLVNRLDVHELRAAASRAMT
jgi:hypothetical protein